MPRYAIQLAYDGSRFVGYQVQPNGPSIQANLDAALNGQVPRRRDHSHSGVRPD